MLEVAQDVWRYMIQMIPLGLTALIGFVMMLPARRRRLAGLGLTSSRRRETALLLFMVFCAGLAALTLFPARFWVYVCDFFLQHRQWEVAWKGCTLGSFYPSWAETAAGAANLSDMLTPFQEIRRALRAQSYWLLFMLLGNIIMFMPIGFFPALLFRRWRWWKSLLAGLCTSVTIEFIQFFIGRSTDIDDVILNTAGALAGFWFFCLLRMLFPKFTGKFQCMPRGGYYRG